MTEDYTLLEYDVVIIGAGGAGLRAALAQGSKSSLVGAPTTHAEHTSLQQGSSKALHTLHTLSFLQQGSSHARTWAHSTLALAQTRCLDSPP